MSRPLCRQQWTDEACYHVLNRGHDRERIFDDDEEFRGQNSGNSAPLT